MSQTDIVVVFAITAVIIAIASYALVRSGNLPHPTGLLTSLSIITITCVILYALTDQEQLALIASTAVGALAGVVVSLGGKDD